jgi:hypothetical protein
MVSKSRVMRAEIGEKAMYDQQIPSNAGGALIGCFTKTAMGQLSYRQLFHNGIVKKSALTNSSMRPSGSLPCLRHK